MMIVNDLVKSWPTLNPSQKREVVLTVGHDMIAKYGVTELQSIEFRKNYKNGDILSTMSHDQKKIRICEKPINYIDIWDNPFLVVHNVPHGIGRIYQRKIENHDVYYDAEAFFAACGENVDNEIFCEIIAISIMNEYFKLHETRSPFTDEYLHQCLVSSVGRLREQYEKDLSLLSSSKMDGELGGIISKCKNLLIDPYFNKSNN